MTPERWAQIEELFHRAAECEPERRAVLLDEVCNDDPELRREVEALLTCQESAGDHLKAAVAVGLDAVGFSLADETISHYRILDGLGEGGMGLVYRAEDIKLGRRVALKFLPDHSAKDTAALARFEREARTASALEHPNICPIYEFGEHEGRPFLVMQLLEGKTLRELMSATGSGIPPLKIDKLLDLAIQILDGLHAAHQKGIIHRDIKPANIFVTSEGQAKILDFGLAKLTPVTTSIGDQSDMNPDDAAPETPRENTQMATSDLFLSRTGVAMGTAGYMSPEQARGEKLDARTDLFSFGLVLYEMATGRRAFSGDTGPELHDAILMQVPAPIRKLNPSIPPKLEPIINKALQKDREARYQAAAELRTDLENLKQDLLPNPHTLQWFGVAAGVVAIFLVSTFVWIKKRAPSSLPELKLRQLTFNSSDNRVTSGAISPDGKYLAYTDAKGMHVQIVDTGEVHSVPPPESLKDTGVDWDVQNAAWFPDSTRFLANAHPAGEETGAMSSLASSIWMVTVNGGMPRKLRDHAVAWSVSPDGSSIAFGTNKSKFGDRELWLMGPNGEQARKLFDAGNVNCLAALTWTPDGQRVIYVQSGAPCDGSNDTLVSSDLNGGTTVTLFSPSEMKNATDGLWLPDGRFIYAVKESTSTTFTCNYWTMRIDARTGQVIEKPARLTNWAGFCMSSTGATANGKRLAFLEWAGRGTVYVADLLAGGRRIRNARQFTLGEDTYPYGWTPDSKTILFESSRNDVSTIYRQSLNSDEVGLIGTGAVGDRRVHVSSDGKWVITFLNQKPGGSSGPEQLTRIPFNGGSPELIFPASPASESSCSKPSIHLCVIVEVTEDRKQMVVTAFDPVEGRGSELARFGADPNVRDPYCICEISPDGTRLAAKQGDEGPIHIISLRGLPEQVIQPKGLNLGGDYHWAADGRGIYVNSTIKGKTALLYVDLQSNAHVVWEMNGGTTWGIPSPDGRHLAILGWTQTSNVWIMENF